MSDNLNLEFTFEVYALFAAISNEVMEEAEAKDYLQEIVELIKSGELAIGHVKASTQEEAQEKVSAALASMRPDLGWHIAGASIVLPKEKPDNEE